MLSLAIKLVKWIMFSDLFICGISSVLWQQYRKDMWEPSDPENCEISQLCFMKISQSLCVPLHQRMLRGGRRLNHQFNHHSIYTKFIKKSLNQDLCTNFQKIKYSTICKLTWWCNLVSCVRSVLLCYSLYFIRCGFCSQ